MRVLHVISARQRNIKPKNSNKGKKRRVRKNTLELTLERLQKLSKTSSTVMRLR